ncbi:hypothetical protein B0O99DRAFT_695556 [Bisporella sp. PMI_857]|nr:hypothetical protein B0O99DRAFT_695556 [Bisporella sp. PMI_857]
MTDLDIDLQPAGVEGASFRWKNAPGQKIRETVMNQGNYGGHRVRARASIHKVTSGTLAPGGDPASLMILGFQFQAPKGRFKRAKIVVEFEQANSQGSSNWELDPAIYNLAPEHDFALNLKSTTEHSTHRIHGTLQPNFYGIAGGEIGYEWELTKDMTRDHYTVLSGTRHNTRESEVGDDNAVIWWLGEDRDTKEGIPRWLRTAVLVKRKGNGPITAKFDIITEVDLVTNVHTFFGAGRKEVNDPITLDADLQFESTQSGSVTVLTKAMMENMGGLDLMECARAKFVTPLDTDE